MGINAIEVAKGLGMEMQWKGSRIFIRCPGHEKRLGHEDVRMTNCILSERGYYCFACGVFVPTMKMAEEVCGSKEEARRRVAEITGRPVSDVARNPFYLSESEADAIGISKNAMPALAQLLKISPSLYCKTIADKSLEMIKKYMYLTRHVTGTDKEQAIMLPKLMGSSFQYSVYSSLDAELKLRMRTAEAVRSRYLAYAQKAR